MPSPQPNTDNIRQLKEEIERLAPQDPAAREERQRLYSELQNIKLTNPFKLEIPRHLKAPLSDKFALEIQDVTIFVLETILLAKQALQQQKGRGKKEKWYYDERKRVIEKIKNLLKELGDHPIVKRAPDISAFVLYALDKVECPHNRPRKCCIEIRSKLEMMLYQQMELADYKEIIATLERMYVDGTPSQIPLKKALAQSIRISGRLAKLTRELKKMGVDPDQYTPDEFCQPDIQEPYADLSFHDERSMLWEEPRGAPNNYLRNYLLATVVACLTAPAVGWSINESCECLGRVLIAFFNDESSAEALMKQWRRLRKDACSPKSLLPNTSALSAYLAYSPDYLLMPLSSGHNSC